jgi:hypothetical protein
LADFKIQKPYGKQEMLRDLFLWSVYVGYDEIAFVLLLRIKSRIGAALLATNMARRLSSIADTLDKRTKYANQANKYEKYASECIDACHRYNEGRACHLLLREIPLFGNVTCMQVRCLISCPTLLLRVRVWVWGCEGEGVCINTELLNINCAKI